ncbi:MAG: DUF3108 domain-containing protein [Candidatus Omnitrophota bacterium]|nr:DUF3108 domain-containing protein [Candidatus Omnitrophota bacterium]
MIKKIFFFTLIVCVMLILILSIKEKILDNPKNILKRLPSKEWSVFTGSKELVFLVKYFGIIPIGKAKIRVDGSTRYEGRDVYKLVAEAETSNFASIFYQAKARIESYMDKNKFYSLRYKEELFLPDKEVETKEIIYDQENLIMTRGNFKRKILPNTQDPLSAIFYLRIQDFNICKSIVMNTITKKENYEFRASVIGKQDDIWLLKSKVQRQDRSSYYHGVEFYLFISDDSRRLPLLIKSFTKIGLVTARLSEVR